MKPHALTVEYKGLAVILNTTVGVSLPFDPDSGQDHPEVKTFSAIWDTGASQSVITQGVINSLALYKIDDTIVHTAAGARKSGVYLINMLLPNKVGFSALRVTEGIVSGFDVLIGMDVIKQGDLSITNKLQNTVMSFQVPSTHRVDYVKEINRKKKNRFRKR